MLALGLVAALAASVAFNVGVVLQAADARREPAAEGLRLSLLTRLARRRRWIVGLILNGVGVGLQIVALALAPFVVVQPMLAAGLLLVLYLSVRMLGERVGVFEVAGVAGVTLGIGLLAWGAPTGAERVTSSPAVISVIAVLAVLAVVPFPLRGRGRWDSATYVVVASAVAFGASNVAIKMVSDDAGGGALVAALTWLVIAAALGIVGLLTEMTALQRRPASLVVPVSFAVQTFLPVLLEPIYLSERWGTAALGGVPLIAGLVMVPLGALALTRSRGVSALLTSASA